MAKRATAPAPANPETVRALAPAALEAVAAAEVEAEEAAVTAAAEGAAETEVVIDVPVTL